MYDTYFKDLEQSNLITRFLIQNYYPKMGNSFEIVRDKERQLKGIDVILRNDNEEILIDEKSTRYYGEDHIPSYFFELSLLNENYNRVVGWFNDPKKITTHYLITWYKYNRYDEIEAAECMLIERSKVKDIIEAWNMGWLKSNKIRYATGPAPECSHLIVIPYNILKKVATNITKYTLKENGTYEITHR